MIKGTIAVIAASFLLASCEGSGGGGSAPPPNPYADVRIQLPINENGERKGRFATQNAAKERKPYYSGNPVNSTTYSPGQPCATSPNSDGCRTEFRVFRNDFKEGSLSGSVKFIDVPSGASIIQACGDKIGCPALMVKYERNNGRICWHVNGEDSNGNKLRDYNKGCLDGTFSVNRFYDFKVKIDEDGSGYIRVGASYSRIKTHTKARPYHWKWGCYSKYKCKIEWKNIKKVW